MPRNTRVAPRRGSSIFTGILIGLVAGAVLVGLVVVLVTGALPFKEAERANTPSAERPASRPADPEPAPTFDFYRMLPEDTASVPPPPNPAESAAPAPRFFLQAGAFKNPADADNLKAQLALLGIESVIQTVEIPDKGLFHRVRAGPFGSMDEVERIRERMVQNQLPATLVRE